MRQLLIVDDEKNIRCGLRAMIERGLQGVMISTWLVTPLRPWT